MAYTLKKTISEVLQSESMPRFQILSQLLPQVEYAHLLRLQQAHQGLLPDSWEAYQATLIGEDTSRDVSDLVQETVIQSALIDLDDLRRRSHEIAVAKKNRGG